MKYCINCGNELGDTKFCTKCGAKAPDNESSSAGTMKTRFCSNCGAEIGDEQYCINCGASTNNMNVSYKTTKTFTNNKTVSGKLSKKFLLIIPIALILVCAIILISNLGKSCEDVASAVVDVEFGCTSRKVVEKYADVLPKKYFDYIVEEGKDWLWDDADGWIDYQYEDNYSDNVDKYKSKFGDDYKYSFRITNEVEYDKEKLESYSEECKQYDITPKAAKDVTIKVRVTGNDTGSDYTIDVTMVKIGSSWYLLDI